VRASCTAGSASPTNTPAATTSSASRCSS
jgi:hypothetical protein